MLPSNKPIPSSFLPTLLEKKSSGVDTYPMPCLDEVVKNIEHKPLQITCLESLLSGNILAELSPTNFTNFKQF